MSAMNASRKLVAAALLMAMAGLAACNTMEGAGQDVQAGGRALEKSADRNK
jgi:predicted small secreted protein